MKFSVISVAFGDYDRFIPAFIEAASKFTDDIVIETERRSMGAMRNRAVAKAKYPYIVSLDIDDELIAAPDTKGDFVGLGWIEKGVEFRYWIPTERRANDKSIRSNIMFSKRLWNKIKFIDHDYYIYEFVRQSYLRNVKFKKTKNTCVIYHKRPNSLSANTDDDDHQQASVMYQQLLEDVRRKK